jgi:prepilin-type N-terminal cleavage/methylation domain-containing protein
MSRSRGETGFSMLEMVFVLAVIAVLSSIAIPMFDNAIADFRLSGDSRSVSNALAVAKMRAASNFGRVRLYVDLSGGTFHLETWDKDTSTWVAEGGIAGLSSGVSFGYGVVGTPPPNTQGTIGQSPECLDNDGEVVDNTACITFNSRGVPIDATLAPFPGNALYLTDGAAVYGITLAATGMLQMWRTLPLATPSWSRN